MFGLCCVVTPTSISMSDSVSLHSALWPGLKPLSLSDSTLSRLHSEADLSLAMAARPREPGRPPPSLSSQIRGSVGRNRSVGLNCFRVLNRNTIKIWNFPPSRSHLFDSFQTSRCLCGTWPAALYLSRMVTTWARTLQNSALEMLQYFCSSDTKPISAGAVSGWSPHCRWNSVHRSASATSQARNLGRK